MKLVIIPIDGAVYINDESYSNIDLSSTNIPSDVHALQWNTVKGWIEFKENDEGIKPSNQLITSLPAWAEACKTKWQEAKEAESKLLETYLLENAIPVVDVTKS